jgi:hypothetical protein
MMLGRQSARILGVLRVQSFSITTNPLPLPYSIGEPVARDESTGGEDSSAHHARDHHRRRRARIDHRRNFPHESISEQNAVSAQRDRERESEARRSRIDREQIFPKPLSAQIDSNSFNLGNLGKMLPPVAGYDLRGMSEIHSSATLDNSGPIFDATVTLKQVGLNWGPVWPSAITDLNGTIRLTQGREIIEMTSLSIGSARANFGTNRLGESAERELCVESRLDQVGRIISEPSGKRPDQSTGRQRYC